MYSARLFILFIGLIFGKIYLYAQIPLIERYTSEDVPALNSVFFIHQDKQGYMYISSGGLTYLYNGKSWEIIKTLNSVRSGINDDDGTVLLGVDDGMGYIEILPNGTRKYVPLTDQLTDDEKKIPTIWHIHKTKEGIFFQGQHYIFQFQKINGKYKKIKSYPYDYINLSFKTPETFFFTTNDTTSKYEMIQTIKNGQAQTIYQSHNTEILAEIRGIIEKPNEWWLFTKKNGILALDKKDKKIKEISTPISKTLAKSDIYTVKHLSNNNITVGTTYNGLFILSPELEVICHIHEGNGLSANNIHEIFEDNQGNVWLGLGSFLNKIKFSFPIRAYNNYHNLKEKVYDVLIHDNTLYAATNIGLYYYDTKTEKFILIEGTKTQCWQLQKYGKGILLAGGNKGAFYIENKKVIDNKIYPNACFSIFTHKKDSTLLIIPTYGGVQITRIVNGKFNYIGFVEGTEADCRKVAQGLGFVWINTNGKGVFKLEIPASIKDEIQLKNVKVEHLKNIPNTQEPIIRVQILNDEPLFITKKNYYTYNENRKAFEPTQIFHDNTIKPTAISKTSDGALWILNKKQIYMPEEKKLDSSSLALIPKSINNIYEYPNKTYYLSCNDGIYIFKPKTNTSKKPFHALISKIIIGKDSLLNFLTPSNIKIAYKYHNLTFKLGSSDYTDEYLNAFQFKLEGFDKDWSDWQKISQKEYTNLREGTYTFRLRTMNAQYEIGQETSFSFTILPPWYRTIWAYIVYLIFAGIVLYVFIRLYTQKLKKDKERLEKIVQERTLEIKQKNSELEQQKEEISAIAENLKIVNDEILTKNALLHQQKEEITAIADNLRIANEEINTQKDIIEEQNKELKESISYAKRIQTAVIPSEEYISQILNPDQYFVFYKPRDIVSGDFYWIADKKVKYIISVTDCTGHCVPGAFMSLIGDSLLNRIVNDYEIHSPDKILTELHKGIFSTLHQQETQVRDSMDSIICTIDKKNQRIELCSNENSVYLSLCFENSQYAHSFFDNHNILKQNEFRIYALTETEELKLFSLQNNEEIPIHFLLEIKGQSTYDSEQNLTPFKPFIFSFQKPFPKTHLYLLSDGLQDQFGGNQGKKFGLNNIRKTLLSMSKNSDISHQKAILENALQQWQAKHEQVDDITVLGIKVIFS
jgi:serine phosphatase RsbU (regulator of sigma subunit)